MDVGRPVQSAIVSIVRTYNGYLAVGNSVMERNYRDTTDFHAVLLQSCHNAGRRTDASDRGCVAVPRPWWCRAWVCVERGNSVKIYKNGSRSMHYYNIQYRETDICRLILLLLSAGTRFFIRSSTFKFQSRYHCGFIITGNGQPVRVTFCCYYLLLLRVVIARRMVI